MPPEEKPVGAGRATGSPKTARPKGKPKVGKPLGPNPKPGTSKPPRGTSSLAPKPISPRPGRPRPGKPTRPTRPGDVPAPALVAKVVNEVNGIYVRGALETALAVASLVVERLLGGDEKSLARGAKDPALASLADHEAFRVPPHTLWTALEAYSQVKLLSQEVAKQLSLAHHRALLGVPETRAKRLLARRAVRHDLNKRQLQEAVTRWRIKHKLPPLGRPPKDPAVAASRRMATAALRLSQAVEEKRPTGHAREDVLRKLQLTEKRIKRVKKTLGIAE